MQKIQGFTEEGSTVLTISGAAGTIPRKVQGSFPAATVTVYLSGTVTLATIYADNIGTPKANPFTAGLDGTWFFYAPNGTYDVQFSGAGIPVPFTVGGLSAFDESILWIDVTSGPYFADRTGVSDSTTAFQNAVAALPTGGGLRILPGTYKITDTIRTSVHGIQWLGSGQRATTISFQPTAPNKVCFLFQYTAASALAMCSIRELTIDSSGNTQPGKVAMQFIDCEETVVQSNQVSNFSDPTRSCIGFMFNGRQNFWVLFNTVFTNRPIVVGDDPNTNIVDFDHCLISNNYLTAGPDAATSAHPCIEILNGIVFTTCRIEKNAFVFGTYGIYCDLSASLVSPYQISIIENRWEQSLNATGYIIYFNGLNAGAVTIMGNYCGALATVRGYYLRNIRSGVFAANMYAGSSEALNIDSSITGVEFVGNLFATVLGATLVTTGWTGGVWTANEQTGKIGAGIANPTNQVVIPNNTSLAAQDNSGTGTEIPLIGLDNINVIQLGGPLGTTEVIKTNTPLFHVFNKLFVGDGSNPAGPVNDSVTIPWQTNYCAFDSTNTPTGLIGTDNTNNIVIGVTFTHNIKLGVFIVGAGGGAVPTLATNVGAVGGPTNPTQGGWIKFIDAGNTPYWVPIWR